MVQIFAQQQPHRGVPRKRYSENMQQFYRRTPTPKCDFLKQQFDMGILLSICCIFSEHLFLGTPLSICLCMLKEVFETIKRKMSLMKNLRRHFFSFIFCKSHSEKRHYQLMIIRYSCLCSVRFHKKGSHISNHMINRERIFMQQVGILI